MNDNLNPYEVVKTRYESNVSSFILSDLFQPTLEVNDDLIDDIKDNELVVYTALQEDTIHLRNRNLLMKIPDMYVSHKTLT